MFRTQSISARLSAAVAIAFSFSFTFATTSPADVVLDPNSRNLPTDIDSPELEVTYSLGFDGTVWQNTATPITFLIKNTSPDFFSGTIEIRRHRYSQEVHRLPIEVGQNSLRRFSVGISLPPYTDGLELRIVRDRKPVWQRTFNNRSNSINVTPALLNDRSPPILAVSPDHTKASIDQSDPTYRRRDILRIAPWELPDHDPVLTPIGGIFLSPTVDLRPLVGARLKALARYVAHGGTLFVPAGSEAWVQKFADELPYQLKISPDAPTPVGLGLLVPFKPGGTNPPWTQKEWLEILSSRPAPNYAEFFQSHQYSTVGRGPRSQSSIGTVTFFIIGYLIAAGPLLFFFRRAKRKNIIRILVVIIGLASIFSVSLGVYLRSSRGDLAWSSMTRLGEGGATQTAVLALSSAGARTHHIDTGSDFATIDPFDFLPNRYVRPSNFQNTGQTLGKIYQGSITNPIAIRSTDVVISPLGSRRIHARGTIPGIRPLEIEIRSINTNTNANRNIVTTITLDVSIKNPNPFPINSPMFAYVTKISGRNGGRINPPTYVITLPTISASGEISGKFHSQRQDNFDNFRMNLQSYAPPKSREPRPLFGPSFPSPSSGDPTSLILLGTLKESPSFNFTGDFIEFAGSHYISQYIDLPPETASKLSGPR